ncbi:hypothetical protein JQN72_00415 [Phycicoccus sp. CSK15P-2]|uniref:Wzz/FepE/Etk N-terminal domain-containing protein n=1 Tax=Phycicoccus sp. CSK15P-2 TaxID=2807627 RepID=UPI00194E1772|nr:Wzz/FepE/Etk N-terminal domain-containing protein [Phycicoccus sp. CSK15P-2]MBM6402707.1 hypothetical protein [Phycicoccus sp. CSK15P-2]
MSVPRSEADIEVADYAAVVRRRWRAILLGVAVGVLSAVVAVLVLPKTYTSTVSVQVQSVGEDGAVQNGRTSSALNLDTEAQIVRSTAVAQLALEQLGPGVDDSSRSLAQHVSVTVPPNTSVLNISYNATSPRAARDGAQEFGEAYLTNRRDVADRRTSATRESIQKQADDAREQLTTVVDRLNKLPKDSPDIPIVSSQRDLLISQIGRLESELLQLRTATVNPGDIITEAQLPSTPSTPNVPILTVSGLVGGLVLGLMLAFGLDRADKRVRGRRDLERLGLDALVERVDVGRPGELWAAGSGARNTETLRQLRNGLLPQLHSEEGEVLVAGVSDDDTGSAVSFHLAEALARSGVDVVYVCANPFHSVIGEELVAAGRPGLAELVRTEATAAQVAVPVPGIENLRVVTQGSSPSLSLELLQTRRTREAFAALAASTQVLVIDVAPTAVNADAQSLAALGYGVLLVTTAESSQRQEVVDALDQLSHVSAVVLGAVVATVQDEPGTTPATPIITPSASLSELMGVPHTETGEGHEPDPDDPAADADASHDAAVDDDDAEEPATEGEKPQAQAPATEGEEPEPRPRTPAPEGRGTVEDDAHGRGGTVGDEPPVPERPVDEPPAQEPSAEQPPAQEPSAEQAPAQEPPAPAPVPAATNAAARPVRPASDAGSVGGVAATDAHAPRLRGPRGQAIRRLGSKRARRRGGGQGGNAWSTNT